MAKTTRKKPPAEPDSIYVCSRCPRQGKPRKVKGGGTSYPNRWKKIAGELCCDKCVKNGWRTAAIEFTAGPADGDWKSLTARLKPAFLLVTAGYNAASDEYWARDIRRAVDSPNGDRMPGLEVDSTAIYHALRARYPQMAGVTAAVICQTVRKNWSAERYDVLWTGKRAKRSYSPPMPIPSPQNGFSLIDRDGKLVLRFRLPDGWIELSLFAGPDAAWRFARLRAALAAEQTLSAELRLTAGRASDGRGGLTMNEPAKALPKLRAKIICRFPATPAAAKRRERLLELRTDPAYLLVGVIGDDDPWILAGDQAKEWYFAEERRRWRLSLDGGDRRRRAKRRRGAGTPLVEQQTKYRRRMKSWIQQQAAAVARLCQRRTVTHVTYDDERREFLPPFAWAELRAALSQALAKIGVEFVASSDVEEISGRSLAAAATEELSI